jgi:thiamine-monophosphate kinase
LGQQLLDKATSCIDVSDGLLADLGHILRASSVGAELDLQAIPLSHALLKTVSLEHALQLALSAGDDYAVCFTSPLTLQQLALDKVSCIGRIIEQQELLLKNKPEHWQPEKTGFDHFHETPSV